MASSKDSIFLNITMEDDEDEEEDGTVLEEAADAVSVLMWEKKDYR